MNSRYTMGCLLAISAIITLAGCRENISVEGMIICEDMEKPYECAEGDVCCQGCIKKEVILTDTNNCGACGNTCISNAICDMGRCVCHAGDETECLEGSTCCDETCVNLRDDLQNCGTCGNACPDASDPSLHLSFSTCSEGECKWLCLENYRDEDSKAENGCEALICGNGRLDEGEICDTAELNGETCESIMGKGFTGTLKCSPDCKGFDTTDCVPPVNCGNGLLDEGEVCDGELLFGQTCKNLLGVHYDGTLKCSANCQQYDIDECYAEPWCGDNIINNQEICDGTDVRETCAELLGEHYVGKVGCSTDCSELDTSECTIEPYCGDDIVNNDEACDNSNFNGATCASLLGIEAIGRLHCSSDCKTIDTSLCNKVPFCGDDILDTNEKCDGNNLDGMTCRKLLGEHHAGNLKCSPNCMKFDTSECYVEPWCGDGMLNGKEKCEGILLNGETCTSLLGEHYFGTLACNSKCEFDISLCEVEPYCGDNIINNAEICDGKDFNGKTCASLLGEHHAGELSCSEDCKYIDTSKCYIEPWCGDLIANGKEKCDGSDLQGNTCKSILGEHARGDLKCSTDCTWDTSDCYIEPYCGDNITNNDEVCDGTDFNGKTCNDIIPGTVGTLSCLDSCKAFNTKNCTFCGNGHLEGSEQCDGNDFGTATCESLIGEHYDGKLTCKKDCTIDTSLCKIQPYCGDGKINNNEACDGDNIPVTCADLMGPYYEGPLFCSDDCMTIDSSKCYDGYIGVEYWAVPLQNNDNEVGRFAVIFSNPNKDKTATVNIYTQKGYAANTPNHTVTIKPGQVLAQHLDIIPQLYGTEISASAYLIISDVPITAYQFNPLSKADSFTGDASLLLPTYTLGQEYYILGYNALFTPTLEPTVNNAGGTAIVATEPGVTNITYTTKSRVLSGEDYIHNISIPEMVRNETRKFKLNQFEVLNLAEFQDEGPDTMYTGDPTGGKLIADKKVAVFGAASCSNIPVGVRACDHIEEQLFPVKTWGRNYIAAKSYSRNGVPDIWRILAQEDNTTISTTLGGSDASFVLNESEFREIETTQSFSISADKPIAVGQYLVGMDYEISENQNAGSGDPSFMLTVPYEQYRSDYAFLVPDSYDVNYITIIKPRNAVITLNNATLNTNNFQPIGKSGFYFGWISLDAGAHHISSTEPIGVTSYGFYEHSSYGYPIGLNLKSLNKHK